MPSIVRGGRRQAVRSPSETQTRKGPAASSPKGASRRVLARNKGPKGKAALIGNVPMSGEMVGWLMFGVSIALVSAILLTGNRAQTLSASVTGYVNDRLGDVGLNLQHVRLNGVSPVAEDDIKKALKEYDLHRGKGLALMDLEAVRARVESVGWVQHASVRRVFPDTLIINVTERPRIAVWQYKQITHVIDDKGQIISEAHPYQFVDLPLVVGEGANEAAADLLEPLRLRTQLMPMIDAIVRVDTRRWDLRLKNGTLIKLPAMEEAAALERLDGLIAQKHILEQGFAVIDLRTPDLVLVPFGKTS